MTENGIKLSKRVENTVGKREIARHEQFLLFPQCFQKACFPGASKGFIVWEWVNGFPVDNNDESICNHQLMKFIFECVENIVGKGESGGYLHFVLFPQCFEMPAFNKIVW